MENELLIRVAGGDEKAFRELYDTYRRRVYSIAFKLIRVESIAEDAVQEVFLKLWLHREKLKEINYFNSYLHTVTRHHILNTLRKMAHEDEFLRELVASSPKSGGSSDESVVHQLQAIINQAINKLPPQQKKVYLLSRSENLSHEEIAVQLNVSKSTVKGHMVGALKFLRSQLLAHYDMMGLFIIWQF